MRSTAIPKNYKLVGKQEAIKFTAINRIWKPTWASKWTKRALGGKRVQILPTWCEVKLGKLKKQRGFQVLLTLEVVVSALAPIIATVIGRDKSLPLWVSMARFSTICARSNTNFNVIHCNNGAALPQVDLSNVKLNRLWSWADGERAIVKRPVCGRVPRWRRREAKATW